MKIGIVCDDHKVEKFLKELREMKPRPILSQFQFTKDITLVKAIIAEEQLDEIRKACVKLEIEFKQSN